MASLVFVMGLHRAPHAFCAASLTPHLQMRDGQLGLGHKLGTQVTFWFQNNQLQLRHQLYPCWTLGPPPVGSILIPRTNPSLTQDTLSY